MLKILCNNTIAEKKKMIVSLFHVLVLLDRSPAEDEEFLLVYTSV